MIVVVMSDGNGSGGIVRWKWQVTAATALIPCSLEEQGLHS